MDHNIIPFSEVQATLEQRYPYTDEENLSDRYFESLLSVRNSLRQLAQEYEISLKEAMIDLTYLVVGDEIVTQLTEDSDED